MFENLIEILKNNPRKIVYVGMQTLDQNLTDLVRRNLISPSEARSKAKIPENFPG